MIIRFCVKSDFLNIRIFNNRFKFFNFVCVKKEVFTVRNRCRNDFTFIRIKFHCNSIRFFQLSQNIFNVICVNNFKLNICFFYCFFYRLSKKTLLNVVLFRRLIKQIQILVRFYFGIWIERC